MSKRGLNLFMMMITLLVLSATGVTLYNKSPDKKITSGVIPFKKDEASSQLALTELPLFKNKKNVLSDEWAVGPDPLPDGVLMNAPLAENAIKLTGTLAGSDCQKSIAIIEMNGIQRSYTCFDHLENNNQKIIRIFSDKVIIDNNGYYESLQINKDEWR